jgi:hypothetical protein
LQVEYRITVQMLEIYNEALRDLLVDPAGSGANRLEILSTQASGCNVPGAVQVRVGGELEVLARNVRAPRRRRTHDTPSLLTQKPTHPPTPRPPTRPPAHPPTHPWQVEVTSSQDVIALMARGAANRATSETKMNDRSSRRRAKGRRAPGGKKAAAAEG